MVAQGHGKFGPIVVADPKESFRIIIIKKGAIVLNNNHKKGAIVLKIGFLLMK